MIWENIPLLRTCVGSSPRFLKDLRLVWNHSCAIGVVGGGIVCWLVAYHPSNRLVYLGDGSALTILRAATLR